MDLQCQLLLYLDKRRFLASMEISCRNFLEEVTKKPVNKFPPLRYYLEIDVMDLIDASPNVGEFLMKEPMTLQRMSSEILFACLKTMNNDRCPVVSPQVAVTLRLKSVPQLLSPTNPKSYQGLVTFTGLLLAVSKPASYVYHSVWSCPEECECNVVIFQYTPKSPPKCHVCRSVLFENSGLRQCGERVTIILKLNEDTLPKELKIVDDLIPKLTLGLRYNINAVVVNKTTFVLSVEEVVTLLAPMTTPIPSDIKDLYKACNDSPWPFIYCLASTIGVKICPMECFMHLKISLLLSLTSIKANLHTGATIIHVLAAGNDTGYVARLMEAAAKLADRCVFLGPSNSAVSTALLASSGGVCVMPLPFHSYSKKQISSILSSVEAGEITTDFCKVKMRGAVWAQGTDFKKTALINVATVFGNVCRGDCGEYDDEIVDFILQNAIAPVPMSKEDAGAVKKVCAYLELVAGIEVSMDERAEMLLRNYFLSARRQGSRGVTVGGMGALVATCVTSARLCRRRTAGVDDAVFSVWLHVSGSPEPRAAPEELLQTPADIQRLQGTIEHFKDWLEKFTDTNIS